jgi:hypothetical protein
MEILDDKLEYDSELSENKALMSSFIKSAKIVRIAQLVFYILAMLMLIRVARTYFEGIGFSWFGFLTSLTYLLGGIATNYYSKVALIIGISFLILEFLYLKPSITPLPILIVAVAYLGFGLYHSVKMEDSKKQLIRNGFQEAND